MKLICLKQFQPEDEFGGPNIFAAIISKKHSYYASVKSWWESETPFIETLDTEVEDNELNNYCFDKIIDFIENSESNAKYDETPAVRLGIAEISEEDLENKKFTDFNNCMQFVETKTTKLFDLSSNELEHINYCLTYLLKFSNDGIVLGEYYDPIDEDELVELINQTK